MFNYIAILITFPLLVYAAYEDVTHPNHIVPPWIWNLLLPIGVGLLIVRAAFLNLIEMFTVIYTIGFMIATCAVLWRVKDSQGHPQLGGADLKCFLCLTLLFPLGLTAFWVVLYSILPFIVLTKLRVVGRFYPFLPFILAALPFAILTGMVVM